MSSYDDVLGRLHECRKRSGLTQEQMGEQLGMKQEQYSYLERGESRISDNNLRVFHKMGWNIDYIITGKTYVQDCRELKHIFKEFDESERTAAMKFPAELLVNRVRKYDSGQDTAIDTKYIDLLDSLTTYWETFSMVHFVRSRMDISQIEMANQIGVGIKKYRDYEREIRYPDAEMLLQFYNMSGYQPTLFLDVTDRRFLAMNYVWNMLNPEDRKIVKYLMRYIKMLL